MSRSLAQDALLTAERDETKHLIPRKSAAAFAKAMKARLTAHHYAGEGANSLPGARHFVTTIYFDTPSRDLYRAACASGSNLKLRAKEYYDLHPGLTEVATDPRQLVRYQRILWLEIKEKDGARTAKRRIGIPKRDVPSFFAEGKITPGMLELQSEDVLREIGALCRGFAEPVGATSLVNYRRMAWQDEAGSLRVTLDLDLGFFAPPADLWTRQYAVVRETLGPAVRGEARGVVEVKSRAAPPSWLEECLAAAGATAAPYSKFEESSRAVHG